MNTQKHDYLVIRQIASSLGVLLIAMLFLLPKTDIIAGSCGDLETYEVPILVSAEQTNDGVELIWNPVTDERFLQYRVLVSKTDSTPEGDVNGYLVKLTNQDATGYTVDGSVGYSLGDFFSFEAGTNYFFAISVEYDCGYFTDSDAIQAVFPDLDPVDLIQPEFTSTWGSKGVTLLWDTIDHDNLEDIRIVASQIDPNPSYPDNGYVAVVDTNTTLYLIDNEATYNVSGFDEFIPGQQYYVALTARYVVNDTDYYATAPAQRVTYEGPGSALPFIQIPVVTQAKATDSGLFLEWNSIDDYRLTEFAVMIDKNNAPSYPYSGFVKVLEDTVTSYTISNTDSFASSDFDYLQYGENYYFSVTAVYGDESRTSAAYRHAYNGALPSDPSQFHPLTITENGENYTANWSPVDDRRIASVYLVIHEESETPGYSDEAWFVNVTNDSGETVTGMSSFSFNENSFKKENAIVPLVDDTLYYAMLTFVLRDGTLFTSQATSFTYDADQDTSAVPEPTITEETSTEEVISEVELSTDDVVRREQLAVTAVDSGLLNRLEGYVLLQVEEAGEAWYVDPDTDSKYYLKDPEVAFTALRSFGLGITNSDLALIPIGVEDRFGGDDSDGDGLIDKLEEGVGTDPQKSDTDGDGFDDKTEILGGYDPLGDGVLNTNSSIVDRLRGRIVLQVEDRGQAWYINPEDGKRYYMKDGQAAFDILRYLSLGIANVDLRKIGTGDLSL
ncbi:MAG: hypothetical protein ACPGO5_00220 [Patescibacteria group bacterium]